MNILLKTCFIEYQINLHIIGDELFNRDIQFNNILLFRCKNYLKIMSYFIVHQLLVFSGVTAPYISCINRTIG